MNMTEKKFFEQISRNLDIPTEQITLQSWKTDNIQLSAFVSNTHTTHIFSPGSTDPGVNIQYWADQCWHVVGGGGRGVAKTLSSALAERQRSIFVTQDRRRVLEIVTNQFRHEALLSSLLGMTVCLSEEDRRNLQWSFSWGTIPQEKALVHFTPEGVITRVQTWSGLNWNQRGGYGSPLVDVQLP